MNTTGNIFRLTTFGESHGKAIGGVIDGCPAGLQVDFDFIDAELARRRPGESETASQRRESDRVEFLSGIFGGYSTGTPIAFVIANNDVRSQDYSDLKNLYRPSHADYTYQQKYGIRDFRGGGRASARETAVRCVAGAIAKLALKTCPIEIDAFTLQTGSVALEKPFIQYDLQQAAGNLLRCPCPKTAKRMEALLYKTKQEGDTVGCVVGCVVSGTPAGLGEPLYGKLHAALGAAMLSINAAKGFDCGTGFDVSLSGSCANDRFIKSDKRMTTANNNSGGIQGGISNGNDIYFRVAFKPIATVMQKQNTLDFDGNETEYQPAGRHDICVSPRVLPVVEAMAAITVFDYMLLAKTARIY